MPRWQGSAGSRAEKKEADRLGIPIFESFDLLRDWLVGSD